MLRGEFEKAVNSTSFKKKLKEVSQHIEAAENTKSSLAVRRKHIRDAISLTNELVTQLAPAVKKEDRDFMGSMTVDLAYHDTEMAKYLNGVVPHAARDQKYDRSKLDESLQQAKDHLKGVGVTSADDKLMLEHGFDRRAFRDWCSIGQAGMSLNVAEGSMAELIYGKTKKVPYPASKL